MENYEMLSKVTMPMSVFLEMKAKAEANNEVSVLKSEIVNLIITAESDLKDWLKSKGEYFPIKPTVDTNKLRELIYWPEFDAEDWFKEIKEQESKSNE